QQGRGNAFARDVGDHQHEFSAVDGSGGGEKRVVVIAGHGILRARRESDFRAGNFRRSRGHEPGLDFARDFQIALHGDFVGQFHGEKKKKNRRGEEFKSDIQDFYVGQKQHHKRGQKQDAARGRELEKQSPEKL